MGANMKILNKVKKLLGFEKQKLNWPDSFYIIDYSSVAMENGLKDDRNKIIYLYYIDEYGKRKVKKYEYSEEMVNSIETIFKVSGFDKTQELMSQKLPVFARILPMEVEYKL